MEGPAGFDPEEWAHAGIITATQAKTIRLYAALPPRRGMLAWHPFWLHVTAAMATLLASIGAAIVVSMAASLALPFGVLWFLLAVAAISAPWTFFKGMDPRLHDALLVSAAMLVMAAGALAAGQDEGDLLALASVPLLAIAWAMHSRPAVRLFVGFGLVLMMTAALEILLPDDWEPQLVASALAAPFLLLMAWQAPEGPYRRGMYLMLAGMGAVGVGTGAYAVATGSLRALAAVVLSTAYLGLVWAAWTGRLRPVEIPPLHRPL